jgi:hypothetical protein
VFALVALVANFETRPAERAFPSFGVMTSRWRFQSRLRAAGADGLLE